MNTRKYLINQSGDKKIFKGILWAKCFALILFLSITGNGYASGSYHALDERFVGYSEEEIDLAYFDIHYSGKWKQSHEMVGRYSLFRSAELALEMGFSAFSIESFVLFDEPDVRIYRTCSDTKVVSDSVVPAAYVSVRYLIADLEHHPGNFSVQELIQMKTLLLDNKQQFDLYAFLEVRGVKVVDEMEF